MPLNSLILSHLFNSLVICQQILSKFLLLMLLKNDLHLLNLSLSKRNAPMNFHWALIILNFQPLQIPGLTVEIKQFVGLFRFFFSITENTFPQHFVEKKMELNDFYMTLHFSRIIFSSIF